MRTVLATLILATLVLKGCGADPESPTRPQATPAAAGDAPAQAT